MSLSERVRLHPFRWFYGIAIGIATLLWTYVVIHQILWPDYAGAGVPLADYYYGERAKQAAEHPYWAAHKDGVPLVLMGYWRVPQVSMFLFFPGAPTVAALLVTGIGWGRKGLLALLSLYRPLLGNQGWREGLRLYTALLLMVAGVAALSTAAAHFLGGEAARDMLWEAFGLQSLGTFLAAWAVALFANQGGLLEELGWRGFAWPLLARRMATPLGAALLLGLMWALWHIPREIPLLLAGQNTLSNLLLGQSLFITMCISMTIVAVYFVNLAGGSVWPAIIVHGCLNMFGSAFKLLPDGNGGAGNIYNPSIWIWLILAALVLLVAGRDLGWSVRQKLHGQNGETDPTRLWSVPASSKEASNAA